MKHEPGTVFTFRIEDGVYGACRVLRGPEPSEMHFYSGHILAHATKGLGDLPVDLKDGDLRKVPRGMRGPELYWIEGKVPKNFEEAGVVTLRKAETTKTSNKSAEWELFEYITKTAWETSTDPIGHQKKKEDAKKQSKKKQKDALADLQNKEQIDLSGFVPHKVAKEDRTPEQTLRGFIAAMNQWEKECNRIFKKAADNVPVHEFNQDSMRAVFDDFCTPKERKYGRLGSFSTPPEYNPRNQKIVQVRQVTARRVEIDTKESTNMKRDLTYVLLKTKDGWLIDNRKSDGSAAIL